MSLKESFVFLSLKFFSTDMGEQLDIDVWVANRAKVEGQVQGRLQTFTFSDLNCTTVKVGIEIDR